MTRDAGLVIPIPMVGVFPLASGTFTGLDDYVASIPNNPLADWAWFVRAIRRLAEA